MLRSLALVLLLAGIAEAQYPNLDLDLPKNAVSKRATLVTRVPAGTKMTYADLEGPGCIRHIWVTPSRSLGDTRNVIIRIFFDGETVPYVECPLTDFFGVMHGKMWYPINTALLSVQAKCGYNCYFPMPFAKSARVEFEAGPKEQGIYCQVDWQSYPEQEFKEKRRFCARWRREFPTKAYGEDFMLMDAQGPGQLVGFVYGVRLIDNTDRWSHGGGDNLYIDGDGKNPSYIRGIGGEDVFGTAYGGATHTPGTHLNAEMPYYVHEDVGDPRPAQNVVGYRWYLNDAIRFEKSIHARFGCMSNDITATVYWYQEQPVKPYFKLPGFDFFAVDKESKPMPRDTFDLPLPDAGSWMVSPAVGIEEIEKELKSPVAFDAKTWIKRPAMHGFIDFGHVHRPHKRGAGVFHEGAASARCVLHADRDMTAKVCVAFDDHAVLRVNNAAPIDLGDKKNFGSREVDVPLKKGENVVTLTLSNTRAFSHGGWAFAFQAATPDGRSLLPGAE